MLLAAIFAIVAFAHMASAEAIEPGYALEIHVMSWDLTTNTLKNWTGWTTQYHVDDDGTIALPFLGTEHVGGSKPGDFAARISKGLMSQLGLSEVPAVTVNIVSRPPVLVFGLVRTAGPQDYRAGMTVRDALAQAGGVPLSGTESTDPLRTRLEAQTLLTELSQKEDELGAKSARLKAEIAGKSDIDFPPLLNSATGEVLRDRERRLLALNADKSARSLSLVDGQIKLLTNEIKTLTQKQKSLDAQRSLAAEQVKAIGKLANQGLAVNSRLLDAQRTAAAIDTQALDTRSAILSAQQDIAASEADRLEIVKGRSATLLKELQQVASDLAETRSKRDLQQQIVTMLTAVESPDEAVTATVTRRGQTAPIAAKFDFLLKPGDVVGFKLKSVSPKG
ncbi:hypothetical protein DT23_15605 [Thioclava indica]|uniref:Soluble ligand binding domain-containing protein n=2 Tax=Thioclava indica TaxID=1353528 RepID=A0A074JWA5_9RHOB|nr:hypothetical protein DT23_15605 [Thioclava indica]